MEKNRKYILIFVILSVCSHVLLGTYATSVVFKNENIPAFGAFSYLATMVKSETTDYGTVSIQRSSADILLFSARALNDDFGPSVVVYKNSSTRVPYLKMYPAGTSMQARFRNHNWALNMCEASGEFDYK